MQIVILPTGIGRCIYGEAIDLAALGALDIRRGSHVEPDDSGRWRCDVSPVSGPRLGPFASRSEALREEEAWLTEHWLDQPS